MKKGLFRKLKGILASAAAVAMTVGMMGASAVPVMADETTGTGTAATTTATITKAADDTHSYQIYQIFTANIADDGKTLTDIKWGSNGKNDSATVTAGTDVPKTVLDTLTSVNEETKSNREKLDAIEKYVDTTGAAAYSLTGNTTSVSVPSGYYLIKDADNSIDANSNDTYTSYIVVTVGSYTITRKADKPKVEKKVADSDGNFKDAANYGLGDTVPFQLKGTFPSNFADYKEYKTYTFTDTLSKGLQVKDGQQNFTAILKDKNYGTINADISNLFKANWGTYSNTTGTTITFSLADGVDLRSATLKDKDNNTVTINQTSEIYISYNATVVNAAVTGSDGNPNEVNLTYSNNPNVSGNGSTGTTPKDKVTVFTFEIQANKVQPDGTDATSGKPKYKALPGATFTLYKGTKTEANILGTGTSDDSGNIVFKNTNNEEIKVGAGTYILSETKAPTGFSTVADITVTVTATQDETADDPELKTLTISSNPEGFSVTTTKKEDNTHITTNGIGSGQIIDYPQSSLPSTGGIGTRIFYTVGGVVVAGAAVLLVIRKKRNA